MNNTPDIPAHLGAVGRYAGAYDESLRFAPRLLPIVLLLLAIASVSLVVGIVLEFGVWTHEEVIHGPFPKEPGATNAWIPVGMPYGRLSCCLGAQTDDSDNPSISSLRAWLNGRELGPAHTLHSDIRTGTTNGFSHWDKSIRFFIPDAANSQTAALTVRYPVEYSLEFLSLNELIVLVLTVLAGVCGLASRMLPVLHVTVRAGIIASAAMLPLYVAFLVAGYLAEQPVPAIYLFRYLPIDTFLNGFEPYLPDVVIVFAILLTALNWFMGCDGDPAAAATHAESHTIDLWRRLGFLSTAGILYLFIAASAWSGHVSAQDELHMNIGGFVPYSDAGGYFEGGLNYLIFGQIDAWNLRRPLAALFRSDTIAFGGFDYVGTILVQIALLSFAIYWATTAIMKWRGVAAGLVLWAMAFILFRPFAITTMTEPLALFWSFCSIPFILHGLGRKSAPHLVVAMAFLFVALFIRMGAMFVMPFLVLWAILYLGTDIRQRLTNAAAVAAVLLVVLLGSEAIDKVYGRSDSELGGNFGIVLCGMSIGGSYSDCYTRYADKLKANDEAQQGDFFYRTAAQNILHDPRTFIRSMRRDLGKFRDDLSSMPVSWYRWPSSSKILAFTIYFVSLAGWIFALRRKVNTPVIAFVIFMTLGIVTSVPLVYFDDATRVLYATNPLLALFIAGGFGGSGVLRLLPGDSLKWQAGALMLPVALGTAILLPFGLRAVGIGNSARAIPMEFTTTQRVIAGHSLQTGFVVLPDSAQLLPDVPSMSISKFREFITANALIPADVVQRFPKPPFAFVLPFEGGGLDWHAYFLPVETFRNKTVQAWKVSFSPLSSVQLAVARDTVPIK